MQYATTSDGVRIAIGTAGNGPWIVRAPSLPFSHSQLEWANGSRFFDLLAANWSVDRRFEPELAEGTASALRERWREAVERAKGWHRDEAGNGRES